MPTHRTGISFLAIAALLMLAVSADAHVRMSPRESAPGATERYSMRVPTERQSPTVRIEIDFPPAATVVSLEPAQGWNIEQKKDGRGRITGAVWSGGSIPFAEYKEFYFSATNPTAETKLEWRVIQVYEDGTRSEWTGPENSRTPAPVTSIRQAAAAR